ncbi:MOSC domain-containing protein [Lihuaxuella thermophila]|uniref:MOSC domain-containing protein YiiM n=1 Tax=Lihuaxuella thermophila TaxID=1173111 RepID=A0A1H8BJA2_9BACL|nr:MOSC domain-containing protein [Lihuaxuella thermophila]SEM82569.1 MOSC domain-containing protein YiiM [Lihuaxuella thermophila]
MQSDQIRLVSLSIGLPQTIKTGDHKELTTGICKQAVDEVFLSREGFHGDGVANRAFHGGPERAVCVYSHEHYSYWEQEFQVRLPSAAFGENLTVTRMLERDVCIGDIYQVGDAVVQVSQGRIPCDTISKRNGIPTLLTRIIEEGYTGFFCRVLREGTVRKDSPIRLLERHPRQVSVLFANQIFFHRKGDAEGIKKILAVKELAPVWRELLANRLEKLEPSESDSERR